MLKLQHFGHLIRSTDSEKILCWERLKEGGEGANRGWDGWMASPTLWTWVWASSRSWWWTGKPNVLQFMGSQSVGHYWATELNWDTQEVASSLWPQSRWRWSFSKLSVPVSSRGRLLGLHALDLAASLISWLHGTEGTQSIVISLIPNLMCLKSKITAADFNVF